MTENDATLSKHGPARHRRRSGVHVSIAALAVVAGVVVMTGNDRTSANLNQALHVAGTAHPAGEPPASLRIASYNIHRGRGRDGQVDLDRIAADLTSCDFAGLYEVAGFGPLQSGTPQSDALAAALKCAGIFIPTERRWWGDHFGNAILSRQPVEDIQLLPLPGTQGKRFRNAVLSRVDMAGGTLNVLAVHIDSGVDREAQLRQITSVFLAMAEPSVLMGDLNSSAEDPQMRFLLAHDGVVDSLADVAPEVASEHRIDWLLVRGLKVLEAGLVDNDHSDHPLVWARVALSTDSNELGVE